MKKYLMLFLACILAWIPAALQSDSDSDTDAVFKKMAEHLSKVEKKLPNKTVAVYGFESIEDKDAMYARYATEKLTHEIVQIGDLTVIERSRIDQILKEQSFSLTGAVDTGTAAKIGKILSVDAVIIGTIRIKNGEVEFIARVIGSEKGIILSSVNERLKTSDIADGSSDDSTDDTATVVIEDDTKVTPFKIVIDKNTYSRSEGITVTWSGLPGNSHDWITLVPVGTSDSTYGEWFYTEGRRSGSHTFAAQEPGDYEVRVYFNWPDGGYVVQKRIKIKVK